MRFQNRAYPFLFISFLIGLFSKGEAQLPVVLFQYKSPKNSLPVTGYYQIDGLRVKGDPFYKPEFILGDMYSSTEMAKNVYIRFDVYYQNVEFISTANKDQILIKAPGDLDSFLLYK
jgi:hypothetical protein